MRYGKIRFEFAVRNEEVECFVHHTTEEFSFGSIDIVELFIQFAGSEHFVYRSQEVTDTEPEPEPEPEPEASSEPSAPTTEPSEPGAETESTCGTECYALPDAHTSDEWCQINCLHAPLFCLPGYCECEDIPCA